MDIIEQVAREWGSTSSYPIAAGAIAVTTNKSLCTNYQRLIKRMQEAKETLPEIPGRIRARVEAFDIHRGHNLPESDEAERVSRSLINNEDGISWRGDGRLKEYHMSDLAAQKYIEKMHFTSEEQDWLWKFAQQLHVGAELTRRNFSIMDTGGDDQAVEVPWYKEGIACPVCHGKKVRDVHRDNPEDVSGLEPCSFCKRTGLMPEPAARLVRIERYLSTLDRGFGIISWERDDRGLRVTINASWLVTIYAEIIEPTGALPRIEKVRENGKNPVLLTLLFEPR